MKWSFHAFKEPTETGVLEQGDVLRKTDELVALLRNYHPFYADHPQNRFFLVLTQSCDLVRRDGPCSARYIALAPVRPLESVVAYEFRDKLFAVDQARPLGSRRLRTDVEKFLARLFNNNVPAYFFLDSEPQVGIADPSCAMLGLPIAFKSDHYETFLSAKLIGLRDSFQAKLGWLLGQMYSRVGTQDFDIGDLAKKVEKNTSELATWVDEARYDALKRKIAAYREANQDAVVDDDVVGRLISELPVKREALIQAVIDAAEGAELLPPGKSPQRRKFRTRLENDPTFSDLIK